MTPNTQIIFQILQHVENELTKLQNILFALKTTDLLVHGSNYEEMSTDAAIRAERITCQLRNLVFISNLKQQSEYMRHACNAQKIRISQENEILSISLPGLLAKRRIRCNTAFLHEPLNFAMQEFVQSNDIQLYKSCVVCFSQVYDESLSLLRIRDYDNLEFKQILDTIAAYVLLDDSGLYCDCYHTTELGESDHTVIYIMDKLVFPKWLKMRKQQMKNISKIL